MELTASFGKKYADREIAVLTAKYFAIDIDRNSQTALTMFNGQKSHQDEAVKRAQEYIEKKIEECMTVDVLAEEMAVGKRSFEQRFKRVTNNSVLEYIQRVKVEAAKRSFETTMKNITEVMFDVGYSDTKAFHTTFKKITGLTPIDYRNKYNKLARMHCAARCTVLNREYYYTLFSRRNLFYGIMKVRKSLRSKA